MTGFQFGVDTLLEHHSAWIRNARVGLVAHAASVDGTGRPTPKALAAMMGSRLACLMGPEHGVFGAGGAGEEIADQVHPELNIPVYSLYGAHRKPTAEMLAGVHILIYDLQDLGVRCYTYVSTLRGVLEAAAEHGRAVIVCDRPVPLAGVCDGPLLDPAFTSFVGMVPAPLVYGLTPAETASWLCARLGLSLDLRCVPMPGYSRRWRWPARSATHSVAGGPDRGLPWIPPSPAIRSWVTGLTYPATVGCEALPALDYGRKTPAAFQIIAAEWLRASETTDALNRIGLPGVRFRALTRPAPNGLAIEVTDPAVFQPVRCGIHILDTIGRRHGTEQIWNTPGTREDFFDKLMGTDRVRHALKAGVPADTICDAWAKPLAAFERERAAYQLYPSEDPPRIP
jgi:uncharacterized protein YbbC (DUF1343 family)